MSIRLKRSTMYALFFAIILAGTFVKDVSHAHHPHDVVTSIVVSPFYEKDQTVFIYVFDELKKSTDGGNSWRNLENGLDNNALISDIVISPQSLTRYNLYVSTKGDGVYRSMDHGVSWHPVNDGLKDLDIQLLSASPDFTDDGILIALTDKKGLFISVNAGDTWEEIECDEFSATSISAVKINGRFRLIVGTENGEIYLSDKSFKQWLKQGQIAGAGKITSLSVQPGSKDKTNNPLVFVGTQRSGLYSTSDLGESFSHLELPASDNNGEQDVYITSVRALKNKEMTTDVFVTLWHESAFVSNNEGKNWTLMQNGLKKDCQADEFCEPHFFKIAVPYGFSQHGEAFIAGFSGLFKTSDFGKTWREIETRQARNIEGLAISPFFSDDQTLVIGTYDAGAYFSQDSGKTWHANNFGLKYLEIWDVAASHYADNKLNIIFVNNRSFISYSDLHSMCDRRTILGSPYWRFLVRHFDNNSIITKVARRILEKPGLIFLSQVAISPNFAQDKTIFLGTRKSGILKSTDAGDTWTNTWQGDPAWVTSCKISPDFGADGIVAAATRYKGFYFSSDSGRTWQIRNKGLSSQALQYKALGTSVLEFSPAFAKDHRLYYGTADGLYLTTDNGENWQIIEVTGKKQREHIKAIGISPDGGIMLVSLKGHGLFKSTNGGKSFSEISPDLLNRSQLLKLIRFSPDFFRDYTIFAASNDEVYVSNDSGDSWKKLDRPVRYENTKDNFSYSNGWQVERNNSFSALNIHSSNIPGSKADFHFIGKEVTWYGPMSKKYGMANIYIDGEFVAKIDQFSSLSKNFESIFTINNLSSGAHWLTIEVLDEKNKHSTDSFVAIDAMDVF